MNNNLKLAAKMVVKQLKHRSAVLTNHAGSLQDPTTKELFIQLSKDDLELAGLLTSAAEHDEKSEASA